MTPQETALDIQLLVRRLTAADADGAGQLRAFLADPGILESLTPDQALELSYLATAHGLFAEAEGILRRASDRFGDDPRLRRELDGLLASEVETAAAPEPASLEDDRITASFTALRAERERIDAYMRLFRGRPDVFARQWHDRAGNQSGYVPVRRPLSREDVMDHCRGRATYGIYLLCPDNTVHVGVLDLDLKPAFRRPGLSYEQRRQIRRETEYALRRLGGMSGKSGLTVILEFSGNKGYHAWFPVAEPVPAAVMRRVLHGMAAELGGSLRCFDIEVFPKQDRLGGRGLGNLVKLPLGIHRASGKPSRLIGVADRGLEAQLESLLEAAPTPASRFLTLAPRRNQPATAARPPSAMPESLAVLDRNCPVLAGIFAMILAGREPAFREEKVLFGTVGHLDDARQCLHYLLRNLPSYSRPLVDFKISRLRGTVLGCRRIHRLLEADDLECPLPPSDTYPHPLLFVEGWQRSGQPVSERASNLTDALRQLRDALVVVERYLPGFAGRR